jgi:hypothetical protein
MDITVNINEVINYLNILQLNIYILSTDTFPHSISMEKAAYEITRHVLLFSVDTSTRGNDLRLKK